MLAVVGFLSPAARADNTLRCTIVDEAGKPSEKVEVVLTLAATGKQWKKKTNDKGEVEFKGLDDGTYNLQGLVSGYLLTKAGDIQLSGDATKTCNPVFVSVNALNALITDSNQAVRSGNVDVALQKAQAAVEMAPSIAQTHFVLAVAQAKKGMVEDAVASGKKAAELDPEKFGSTQTAIQMEALGARAGQALAKKDFDTAIATYKQVIAIDPKEPTGYYNMSLAYAHKGDFNEAIKAIDQAIALKPGDAEFQQRKIQLQDLYLQEMNKALEK
jgi:tetratricopeptide (TPR) repeat protein